MLEMTILKEAKVVKDDDHYIEVKIGEMNGRYSFGLKYQNGSSGLWATLVPSADLFRCSTEREAISKAIEWLTSKTRYCLEPCVIACNHCRFTQQMHDAIV